MTDEEYRERVACEGVRQLRTKSRRRRARLRRRLARERQRAFENGKDAGKRLAECQELPY